jgi:hypothetical protein
MAVAAVKAHFAEVLQQAAAGERVIVERRGKPIAVLDRYRAEEEVSPHWFDRLYGLLSDDATFDKVMKGIVRARRTARPRRVDLG